MVNIITVLKPNIRLKMVSKRDFGNTIIPMERLRPLVRMLMKKNRIWLTGSLQGVHFYEKDYYSSNFKVIKQEYQDIKISVSLYEKW